MHSNTMLHGHDSDLLLVEAPLLANICWEHKTHRHIGPLNVKSVMMVYASSIKKTMTSLVSEMFPSHVSGFHMYALIRLRSYAACARY